MRDKLKADPDYEKHLQLRCRCYPVFNAQQIDGIPVLEERRQTDIGTLRQQRDTLIRNMGIGYKEYGNRAFYSPSLDRVVLPPEASFDDTYSYMATFLHECGHASGAAHRLNRDLSGFRGSESYAREELRAEIASAFTAQSLGLQLTPSQLEHHTQLHAAYIQSWASILKDAPDELFRAIKAAEEISDYLIEKGEFNLEQAQTAAVKSLEEFQGEHGVSSPVSDFMLDKTRNPHGLTGRQQAALQKEAGLFRETYAAKREAVTAEYHRLVREGEIRPPTTVERLIKKAIGHDDNPSTQAARRSLEKRGIDWATGDPIRKGEFDLEHKQIPRKTELKKWYIVYKTTNPLDGELTVVPAEELQGREVLQTVHCSNLQEATEKLERYQELQQYFWDETNDPETQEWREELTADEAAMVEQWDLQTAQGFSKLASKILERSTPVEQILIAIESTDDYADANFHADLHNPEKQNPDGSYGTPVDYYRLVKIGDSGRIEVLDSDLVFPTKAQAKAVAESIPYARLVDYDTLVHEVGKNLTAKYTLVEIPDSPDLRLHFHGYGRIEGYSSPEARPWQAQINRIREISIDNGITEIGRNVLNDYPAVEEISWPGSITRSDPFVLQNCPNLKGIAFPGAQDRVNSSDLHSPSKMLELAEKYPGLKIGQYEEISAGLNNGLTAEQVDMYAKPDFSAAQMNAIRYCLSDGLTADQLQLVMNPAFDHIQIDIIRSGFQCGMTLEEVTQYARPELPAREMLNAYWCIRNERSAPDLTDKNLTQGKEVPESMTVVMVEPDQQARIVELPYTLEAMQQAVGGSIQAAHPFDDPVVLVCNKESKLDSLPLNRALYGEGGDVYDILCGTFFVAGVGTEDFCSLSPDLAQKYLEQYKSPEQFFRINGHIVALKTEQENIGQALDNYLAGQNVSQDVAPAPVAETPTLTMGG